ncbi:MAG: DinB family protein [Candidatus Dormibacteraeota bacterium]|nr:DinB family protein [Candidatus Dormibacteraeota bacterium]
MTVFEEALTVYAALPERELSEPWAWPGHEGQPLEVRDAVLRSLELEHAALACVDANEVARAVAQTQAAFGDLRGLLCGLPDELLDAEPGHGEWTLRQVLQHMLWVDRQYQVNTAHAARRTDEEPLFPDPDERQVDAPTLAAWLELLTAARRAASALLTIPERQLTRPTAWAGYAVDVRFRLHRRTGHLVQHTVQCEKVLRRLGHPEPEARQLVRRISGARGGHELLNEPGVLRDLDEQHRGLADSISR